MKREIARMSKVVEIRTAAPSDSDEISDFICEHFNDYEPIQMFYHRPDLKMDPPPKDLNDEAIASETLLHAYIENQLVGVLIASEITNEVADKDKEYASSSGYGQKGTDVFNLLSYIGEKADLCNRLSIPNSLHIHIVSVHRSFLKLGIASKLFVKCVELARVKKYPACSVDCTSSFTSRIAESCGMKCESIVTYEEYNEHVGAILFVSREPHTSIKTYAKILNNEIS